MTKSYIGTAAVDSGQLIICDPCYIDSEWAKEAFEDIRIYQHAETGKTLQYKKDFNRFDEIIPEYGKTMNDLLSNPFDWERLPSPKAKDPFSYNACCLATLEANNEGNVVRGGQLYFKNGLSGVAVAFSTAIGDGEYPVFATYNDLGELISVEVRFDQEATDYEGDWS